MKKIIVIFILLLTLINCKVNNSFKINTSSNLNYIPYYLKVYEADSLYNLGEYKTAYSILDNLFNTYKIVNMERYNEYETYLRLKVLLNNKSTKDEVLYLFSKYGNVLQNVKKDSLLNRLLKNKRITLNDYKNARDNYLATIDFKKRQLVISMVELDQKYRRLPRTKEVLTKIKESDSLNKIALLKLLKNGFVSRNSIGLSDIEGVGNYERITMAAILNHIADIKNTNFKEFEQIHNRIAKLVKMGVCEPYNLAFFDDGRYVKLDKPDKLIRKIENKNIEHSYLDKIYYYSRFDVFQELNNKQKIMINKNRKNVGLETIEQELNYRENYY